MTGIYYGDDYDYASSRLRNTIVKYDDKPVFVQSIDTEEGSAYITSLWGSNEMQIGCEDLDMSPIPLGFVNVGNNSSFLVRRPSRYYKQGLCESNTRFMGQGYNLLTRQVNRCMLGLYPDIMSVLEQVICGEYVSQGVSRNFALTANDEDVDKPLLMYRTSEVGHVSVAGSGNNINYKLNDDYSFLNEVLEREINV